MSIPSYLALYTIQHAFEEWQKFGWVRAETEKEALRIVCDLYNLSFFHVNENEYVDRRWRHKKDGSEYYISINLGATHLIDFLKKFQLLDNISFHLDNCP